MADRSLAFRRARRVVIVLLASAFVIGAITAWQTGVSPASIRAWLDGLGPAGPLLFALAFALGSLIGVPGMAFVVSGRLAFGAEIGLALGYGAGLLSCLTPFVTARLLGGGQDTVWNPRAKLFRRALDMVDGSPIRAVAVLRVFMWFNAPLSYTLALTRIRLGSYAAGCAIGIVPCVVLAMVATSWFV